MRQVWLGLPYLLQVWYILTILAASMVNRAQLAASLAAPFRQYQLGVILAALFRQHQVASTKAIKEFQVSRAKIKVTRIAGGFDAYASSLRLHVARAQQAKALNIKMARRLIFSPLAFHRD